MIIAAMNKVQKKRSLHLYCFIFLPHLTTAARSLRFWKEFRFILLIVGTKSEHILLQACFTEKQKATLNQPHFALSTFVRVTTGMRTGAVSSQDSFAKF